MRIRFIKQAQAEVDDAVAWYESQLRGLSLQFLDDFDSAVRRIAAYPLANAEIEDGLRRCLLSKFPYGITKKTVSKATFIVIARLDRAIQNTLKTLDSRLRGNDSTWGLTYGPLNIYGIDDAVIVIAVAHMHREPRYWTDRTIT